MPDPLLLPSIAMLSGGGLLAARDYLRRRLEGTEDRYMALYGKNEWEASNMDLTIHAPPAKFEDLKAAVTRRLDQYIQSDNPKSSLLFEEADLNAKKLEFGRRPTLTVQDLLEPRRGVYFDMEKKGRIRF
ncbi:MAG: hypothetical protein AAF449_07630, partial [Myxococcota bacterium]